MKNYRIGTIFCTLTKALMTMSVCGSVYLLRTVVRMLESPASALQLYHSFPELTEHIVAGILFYVLLAGLFLKNFASDAPSV